MYALFVFPGELGRGAAPNLLENIGRERFATPGSADHGGLAPGFWRMLQTGELSVGST